MSDINFLELLKLNLISYQRKKIGLFNILYNLNSKKVMPEEVLCDSVLKNMGGDGKKL